MLDVSSSLDNFIILVVVLEESVLKSTVHNRLIKLDGSPGLPVMFGLDFGCSIGGQVVKGLQRSLLATVVLSLCRGSVPWVTHLLRNVLRTFRCMT